MNGILNLLIKCILMILPFIVSANSNFSLNLIDEVTHFLIWLKLFIFNNYLPIVQSILAAVLFTGLMWFWNYKKSKKIREHVINFHIEKIKSHAQSASRLIYGTGVQGQGSTFKKSLEEKDFEIASYNKCINLNLIKNPKHAKKMVEVGQELIMHFDEIDKHANGLNSFFELLSPEEISYINELREFSSIYVPYFKLKVGLSSERISPVNPSMSHFSKFFFQLYMKTIEINKYTLFQNGDYRQCLKNLDIEKDSFYILVCSKVLKKKALYKRALRQIAIRKPNLTGYRYALEKMDVDTISDLKKIYSDEQFYDAQKVLHDDRIRHENFISRNECLKKSFEMDDTESRNSSFSQWYGFYSLRINYKV